VGKGTATKQYPIFMMSPYLADLAYSYDQNNTYL
jgi:hypothetical protein